MPFRIPATGFALGLADLTTGSIRFGNRELSAPPAKVLARNPDRARIQIVFQDAGGSIKPRFIAAEAIARAIGLRPDLLVVDEPTAAFDVSVQVTILQLLVTLRETLGISYVFVSHDLKVVWLQCDLVVMYPGRIVEVGPARAVFAVPLHSYTRGRKAACHYVAADGKPLSGVPGRGWPGPRRHPRPPRRRSAPGPPRPARRRW